MADHLRLVIPKETLRGGVDRLNEPLLVNRDDGVHRRFHHGLAQLLGGGQRFARPLQFRHIPPNAEEATEVAIVSAQVGVKPLHLSHVAAVGDHGLDVDLPHDLCGTRCTELPDGVPRFLWDKKLQPVPATNFIQLHPAEALHGSAEPNNLPFRSHFHHQHARVIDERLEEDGIGGRHGFSGAGKTRRNLFANVSAAMLPTAGPTVKTRLPNGGGWNRHWLHGGRHHPIKKWLYSAAATTSSGFTARIAQGAF